MGAMCENLLWMGTTHKLRKPQPARLDDIGVRDLHEGFCARFSGSGVLAEGTRRSQQALHLDEILIGIVSIFRRTTLERTSWRARPSPPSFSLPYTRTRSTALTLLRS